MSGVTLLAVLVLLIAVSGGMVRILIGPTAADRMLAIQLLTTCGVAILLLLAQALERSILVHVALVFALLAVLAVMTFILRTWQGRR
ncbi:MAG: multiple resistance and pH regulation protein F [Desulfobulbaceae bacterium]|uniref:Multiple resistance and pH regulation protein F n=1 Tax=Candidatus Desulfatifera sulfidica TaxID=2841691 RepID=A0A8J6T903_9BACT|nr:multiple resistance and pH regulation protein F [Candidatus Desulfatifera sulfidica]